MKEKILFHPENRCRGVGIMLRRRKNWWRKQHVQKKVNRQSNMGTIIFSLVVLVSLIAAGCSAFKNGILGVGDFSFVAKESLFSILSLIPELLGTGLILFISFLIFSGIQKENEEIKQKVDKSFEITPESFLEKYRGKSVVHDAPGVYVLFNETKGMYYVGQGKQVISRVKKHFTGYGNGDVYADWKNGDSFKIRVVYQSGSGYSSLNELERKTIRAYNAYYQGYNKTRGNRG